MHSDTDHGIRDTAERSTDLNVYRYGLPEGATARLDIPDVLKRVLELTFAAPGTYRIDGRDYVVGDPEVDSEISVCWKEDELTGCSLTVWPGSLQFRRRALAGGEPAGVATLAFRSLASPDGRELVEFARAADL